MHPFRRKSTLLIATVTLLGAQSALAGKPTFHHHRQGENGEEADHYKDSGEKPAKAKVGQTVFTSRALLGKNGVTDLEVTTGTLDSNSVAPGYLSEVHVKAFREDGTHQFEKQFEHLKSGGGYAKFSFPLAASAKGDENGKKDTRLEHGQRLSVKVEGKGLLSSREGEAEAKLDNTVKYRPDPTVVSLQYVPVARPNADVDISAAVIELMNDTGAHLDCVLSVDGVAVDTAPGAWVDANGSISCHFRYAFAVAGQHTLTVSLQNVAPADFDSDNNSLSGTIKIQKPAVMGYFVHVDENVLNQSSLLDIYAQSDPNTVLKHQASNTVTRSQNRAISATIPAAVNLPLAKVAFADQSDGASLSAVNLNNLAADVTAAIVDEKYDTVSTIERFDGSSGGWFTLTRYSNATTGAGETHIAWKFYGGDVTVHSNNYCKSVGAWSCQGGDWNFNTDTANPTGESPAINLGSMYGADIVVDDGTPYQAHPKFDLTKSTTGAINPVFCRPGTMNQVAVRICSQNSRTGSMSSANNQFDPTAM